MSTIHTDPCFALTVVMGETNERGLPLFDSANDWGEATRRLIGRKRYAMEGQV